MPVLKMMLTVMVGLLVSAVEGVCWLIFGIGQTLHLTGEVIDARRRLAGGLHCERGHIVPTVGTWECGLCHFRWEGSVWRCANPECHAVTSFIPCPVCRLSVRNPFRFEGGHEHAAH